MVLLSRDAALRALEGLGWLAEGRVEAKPGAGRVRVVRTMPEGWPPAQNALLAARLLARWLLEPWPTDAVVLLSPHGVSDHSENLPLFHAWRRTATGDARPFDDAPGHRLDSTQLSELITLLQLGMVFGWRVAAGTNWRAVDIDHDHHVAALAGSEAECRTLLDLLPPRPRA